MHIVGEELQQYLILNNVGKRGNFGTLIRSAAAMGVNHVFVVGAPKLRTFGSQVSVVLIISWLDERILGYRNQSQNARVEFLGEVTRTFAFSWSRNLRR